MQRFTWEEIAESQDFEHGQEFVTFDEHIDCIAMAKGQFDIVKMQRDRAYEIIEMMAGHRKMPHQHSDPQTKLYCLTERANEFLENNKR